MWKKIWAPAIAIPIGTFVVSVVIFMGIALIMDAIYPMALAFGTILFIAFSAAAWFLAQRTEKEHAANNPDAEQH